MRHLLHFGLFALTLTAVTQAGAQDTRHGGARLAIEVAAYRGPRRAQPVRPSVRYDRHNASLDAHRDLAEIVSIARRWERATAHHDRQAELIADRQLDAWLEREIRESIRRPYAHQHGASVRALSNELALLEQRAHRGRGHRGYHARKMRILDQLVELSRRQVRLAYAGASLRVSR